MCLTSQPESMNSQASQSSSAGFGGGSPWAPRSSSTLLRPRPKNCFHSRFITVRAVSGFSRDTSQRARSSRFNSRSPRTRAAAGNGAARASSLRRSRPSSCRGGGCGPSACSARSRSPGIWATCRRRPSARAPPVRRRRIRPAATGRPGRGSTPGSPACPWRFLSRPPSSKPRRPPWPLSCPVGSLRIGGEFRQTSRRRQRVLASHSA